MITYVDTSVLIKLVVEEPGSEAAEQIWQQSDSVVASRLIVVEARAALATAERSGRITADELVESRRSLIELVENLGLIEVTASVIDLACNVAETQRLRGYDAVHLASAAIVAADVFASADARLCDAASAEGIHVANPIGS